MTSLFDDPADLASSVRPLTDEDDRRRIRHDLDETLIVEAAAGTGKTTELVYRIVLILATGRARVEQIVAVTFTEKAAGELKLRLREGLEKARRSARRAAVASSGSNSILENLEQALASLEEAHVSTIHGFCAELLRERPVEAEVDPAFRTLTDGEARRLFEDAFETWLHGQLEDPPEGVRRSLRRPSSYSADGPTGRLSAAGWILAEWRDFPEPWRRDPWDRKHHIDRLVEQLHQLADLTRHPHKTDDNLHLDTAPVRRLCDSIRQNEAVRERDYDGLEASLVALTADRDLRRARKGSGYKYGDEIVRSHVVSARDALRLELQVFARNADADLAALLHGELAGCLDEYDESKRRIGRLDFVDLLVRARNLVRECAPVRAEFQRRFTHLFVDEFQDTDPLQAELLLLLAADSPETVDWRRVIPVPGKLFVVGDPKQSIYRFRRAEVGIYQEVKAQLLARGGRLVHLRTSFRASPDIQRVVNAAFAPVMDGDPFTLQADYVGLEPFREELREHPSLVVLPVPAPYGAWGKVTRQAIEQSLPDATAAFLDWLIRKSGWKVTERDQPDVPVDLAARHVCLLFRRFEKYGEDVTRGYLDALEARGIPHLLVGGKSFHHREEVETVRAALCAIEWPDDELAVFATVRGSLFAVSDEALLEYRHRFGRLHPFRIAGGDDPPLPVHLAPIAEALGCLQDLHRHRNNRPLTDTIERLLETTRAHAGFVLRPSGEQTLANVLQTVELARTYERNGGLSFRGFVDQLRDEADRGEAPEAPILEEGSDGVRLMTVHKAKGLEFPVVVLVDITAPLSHDQAARHVDRDRGLCAVRLKGWSPAELLEHEAEEVARERAEGIRVAYVAATRARDLLVVPAVGDQPLGEGWIGMLNPAIYPAAGIRPDATAAGCPTFGRDSVQKRPEDAAGTLPVCPGLHVFPAAGIAPSYSVVWWDPHTLELGVKPEFGKRYEQLVDKKAGADIIEKGRRLYEQWRSDRLEAIRRGSTAGLTVTTATRQALDEAAAARREDARQPLLASAFQNVEVVELVTQARPAGARYGALVHAVLATIPLDAARDQIEEVAALQARILGAPESEYESAVVTVETALGHPLLDRARLAQMAGQCRRETPITLLQRDGSLIEGVVDLAFRESGRWTVVDFKTDRELAQGLEIYRRQVDIYARAVAESTGEPATPILMRI